MYPSGLAFNSLWLSDTIWRQGSRSTLVQVMACCLTAQSHYLNQCWLNITEVPWCSSERNFAWISQPSIAEISLKIIFLRFYWNLPATNGLTLSGWLMMGTANAKEVSIMLEDNIALPILKIINHQQIKEYRLCNGWASTNTLSTRSIGQHWMEYWPKLHQKLYILEFTFMPRVYHCE